VREDPLAAASMTIPVNRVKLMAFAFGAIVAALAGTIFAAHAIAGAISAKAVAGGPQSTGWIATALREWVIVPASAQVAGNFGFVLLVGLLIALVQAKGRWRTILLVPTLYLASFVWETRLSVEPAITRQLMIGAILIVMMNSRPQGLLGARRVEALT
jgi:branched-chain amino acid transport system permease protein